MRKRFIIIVLSLLLAGCQNISTNKELNIKNFLIEAAFDYEDNYMVSEIFNYENGVASSRSMTDENGFVLKVIYRQIDQFSSSKKVHIGQEEKSIKYEQKGTGRSIEIFESGYSILHEFVKPNNCLSECFPIEKLIYYRLPETRTKLIFQDCIKYLNDYERYETKYGDPNQLLDNSKNNSKNIVEIALINGNNYLGMRSGYDSNRAMNNLLNSFVYSNVPISNSTHKTDNSDKIEQYFDYVPQGNDAVKMRIHENGDVVIEIIPSVRIVKRENNLRYHFYYTTSLENSALSIEIAKEIVGI